MKNVRIHNESNVRDAVGRCMQAGRVGLHDRQQAAVHLLPRGRDARE